MLLVLFLRIVICQVLIIVIYCDICDISDAFNFYCSYIDICISLCVVSLN